ncbi:MAG TPA: TlpA disulfide reductase family protein [Gammaproteobacteria bacterium]
MRTPVSAKIVGVAMLAAGAWLASTSAHAVEQGDRAPAWMRTDFDDRPVMFPGVLAGRPAVVVFWATWCPYCKALMPYLEDIQADYAEAGVKIIAINAKEDGKEDPKAYVRSLRFPLIAVQDGDAIANAYDVEYLPGLMIVGGDGVVAWRRAWTDLPAGRQVAELWAGQIREQLDALLGSAR